VLEAGQEPAQFCALPEDLRSTVVECGDVSAADDVFQIGGRGLAVLENIPDLRRRRFDQRGGTNAAAKARRRTEVDDDFAGCDEARVEPVGFG